MTNINLPQLEPQLKQRLEERATKNGRKIEDEITAILSSVLLPETSPDHKQDLATAIAQRFAPLGEFDIPETPRESIRETITF